MTLKLADKETMHHVAIKLIQILIQAESSSIALWFVSGKTSKTFKSTIKKHDWMKAKRLEVLWF